MMTLLRDASVSRPIKNPQATRAQPSALRPLSAPRSLTHELVARLTADITSGKLAPGSQLPTEQEMIKATGVSRTVVREAVAALRAEGLVLTRQGVGAFVANSARRPFRIDIEGLHSLREVLDVMELRTGMEVEAAGLAAERGTPAQIRKIEDAYAAIDRAIAGGRSAVDEDFAFHCSIASATGNPQFLRFLDYLGRHIIPRQSIRVSSSRTTDTVAYLRTIQKEHRDILEAIRSSASNQARACMRRHLLKSRTRYQKLATKLSSEANADE
jgi:GntR family transcriptional regulator, transcriptional repressor for pyruvate dehydrogenase complex